jgi:anaerobic selenocysteine-containing dehydrogenase
MNKITACPLDCYDGCKIVYEDEKIKPYKSGHTDGFLCGHMHHYQEYDTIKKPRYKGNEITLNEALLKLKEIFVSSKSSEILHYKGSGNFALMQDVTESFFAPFGAVLTDGSLCDSAGEAGIIEGRGSNKNMPLGEIAKSEVVIFWGRNPHTTSSHILPLLKGKKIIVIDPIKTKIAKMADVFVQIKPHSDLYLAMLLSRFLMVQYGVDEEYLERYASEYEDFYELTQTIRIKAVLEDIDVSLGDIGDILESVVGKKVAIVCGVGVQKYRDGADVLRAIDAFGVMLGLFGKEGCGISYLGNSKANIPTPFDIKAKRVSKVDTEFADYKTVFIQGANPLSQMPNSLRVKESISKVENVIYFGLYENKTSSIADLVIPAKSFLYKNDIRTSYAHNGMMFMDKVLESQDGISEYDLTNHLCREFDIELKSEEFYIKHFKSFAESGNDGEFCVKDREDIPYKDGFDTDDGEFVFLEEFEAHKPDDNKLFLITPKSDTSLNSQFHTKNCVYLHPSLGFLDKERVEITSVCGSVVLEVCLSEDVRKDSVLIYSGTEGVNNLTTSKHSFEGRCAVYQDEKIKISKG